MLTKSNDLAHLFGQDHAFAAVLFGGLITSFYSILQFIFAPFWGSLSDRRGRRGILLKTVAGTALGYLVWVVSGSFWLFLVSRIVSGAFSGNLSVVTAAVADVDDAAGAVEGHGPRGRGLRPRAHHRPGHRRDQRLV